MLKSQWWTDSKGESDILYWKFVSRAIDYIQAKQRTWQLPLLLFLTSLLFLYFSYYKYFWEIIHDVMSRNVEQVTNDREEFSWELFSIVLRSYQCISSHSVYRELNFASLKESAFCSYIKLCSHFTIDGVLGTIWMWYETHSLHLVEIWNACMANSKPYVLDIGIFHKYINIESRRILSYKFYIDGKDKK